MIIEQWPLDRLIPYVRNPRNNQAAVAAVKASIKEFGFRQPIVIDKEGVIVAGHTRFLAAQQLGLDAIPVHVATELTPVQIKAYRLADNRTADNAIWDDDLLALELQELRENDFDLELTGFNETDLARLIDQDLDASEVDAEPQIDKAEELREHWQTATGQLWQLGDHRLICGDCTDPAVVARVMDSEKAELLFTSPPYADLRDYGGNDLSGVHKFIFAFATQTTYQVINLGIIRRNGEIIPYWDEYIAEAKRSGLKLLSWNVWDKLQAGSIGNQSSMFAIEHEWLFVFGMEPKKLNRTVEHSKDTANRLKTHRKDIYGRKIRSVRQKDNSMRDSPYGQDFSAKNLSTIVQLQPELARDTTATHPAVFPVSLPTVYIDAITDEGDYVAEPFAGSGTTIIACERLGRKCRAIEISPSYVAVTLERFFAATGIEPKPLSG